MSEKTLTSKKKATLTSDGLLAQHEDLFRRYYRPLVVYATRWMHDLYDAEDVVQEVFGQLWKKKEEIEYGEGIASYLFGAVRNACMNHARHLKVVRQYERETEFRKSLEENPYHYLLLGEIEKKIDQTLNTLPKNTKEVFLMSRFEQKKNKEIAAALNISIKTVEAHITKVLSALRTNLRHYIGAILLVFLIG